MNRHKQPSLQRRITKTTKNTTRSLRRAWHRHVDRLANDPSYRDDLIDVAILIAATVIRHPAMRLLDARLILRRGANRGSTRRQSDDERPGWGSSRNGYDDD